MPCSRKARLVKPTARARDDWNVYSVYRQYAFCHMEHLLFQNVLTDNRTKFFVSEPIHLLMLKVDKITFVSFL